MPQVVIDFSKGLDANADFQALCEEIRDVLTKDTAVPHPDTIRVRARSHDYFATGLNDQSFAHANFLMLEGRDTDTKTHMCTVVLDVMEKYLPNVASLSVQPFDVPKVGGAKRIKD